MALVTREDVQTVQDDVHVVDGKTTEEAKVSEQSLDRERRITKIESWLEESDKRLATKKDVEEVRREGGAVRSDVLIEVEKVRTEGGAVRSDVLIEVEKVRTEVEKVRREVGAVRSDVLTEVAAVRSDVLIEVEKVRTEVRTEVEKVRTEVRTEAEKVRADMASFKADMRIWLIGAIVLLALWEDRVAILQWILRVAGGGP